ncbi:MAG TPA: 4Fe-4S dicluster domain-containing protein, partial [Gemmatimonadales bacterium]|nr:4Fe-4S dicluster domain-containing protein [Gemmatimonadales bacterium]
RRSLFRTTLGDWLGRMVDAAERRVAPTRYVRPPGAIPEVGFLAACTRCGLCVQACPPHAIATAGPDAALAAGTPFLDLEREPCVACPEMPCARACPTGALVVPPGGWAGYRLAELEFLPERCVTYRGTSCRACADSCPVGPTALVIDDTGHPALRREGCVGCGVCVRACITRPSSLTLHYAES